MLAQLKRRINRCSTMHPSHRWTLDLASPPAIALKKIGRQNRFYVYASMLGLSYPGLVQPQCLCCVVQC